MTETEKIFLDAIFARRSIRQYVPGKEVEREKIIRLLEAAMAAPSACNIQPWEFIVVSEPETLQRMKDSIARFGDYNAPLIIAVCGASEFIPWENDNGVVDCAAAIENMFIAAQAMGLGSVWVGGFDADAIRKILDIPEPIAVQGLVYLGYPAEQPEPRTKYVEEAVYWQKYDPQRTHHRRPGSLITD